MRTITATCDTCGFTTSDLILAGNHSCEIALQGNRCEDYPCCGHEAGDCNGLLYGSDEAIKARVYAEYYADDYYADDYADPSECEHDGLNQIDRNTVKCAYCDLIMPRPEWWDMTE